MEEEQEDPLEHQGHQVDQHQTKVLQYVDQEEEEEEGKEED